MKRRKLTYTLIAALLGMSVFATGSQAAQIHPGYWNQEEVNAVGFTASGFSVFGKHDDFTRTQILYGYWSQPKSTDMTGKAMTARKIKPSSG